MKISSEPNYWVTSWVARTLVKLKKYPWRPMTPENAYRRIERMKSLPIHNEQYKTLIDSFGSYLKTLGYNQGTQTMLPSCIREFLHEIEKQGINQIQNVQPKHIQNHYEYLQTRPNQRRSGNLSGSMLNHHMYAIRKFFSYQEQMGIIQIDPSSSLEFKRQKSEPREILTTEEIKELYAASETLKDKAILGMFYGCGLRRSEGERLNITDINFKSGLLFVQKGKGNKSRTIPINQHIANDFKNYLHCERGGLINAKSPEDALILNMKGQRMSGNSYNIRLKEIIQLTKNKELQAKNISLHSLRHSIATHLLDNGLSVEYVRDFLGHRHLESTQVYTRINLLNKL